jgi:hypothetical protein
MHDKLTSSLHKYKIHKFQEGSNPQSRPSLRDFTNNSIDCTLKSRKSRMNTNSTSNVSHLHFEMTT